MLVENQLSAADCIAAFRQFDRDGNGLIDAAEFSFVLSTLLGLHLTKPQMTQLWRGLDINNSGVINFAEARRIVPTNAPRTSHPHPPAHAHPHPHPHPHPSPIHLAPPSLRPQFNSTLFSDSPCSTLSSQFNSTLFPDFDIDGLDGDPAQTDGAHSAHDGSRRLQRPSSALQVAATVQESENMAELALAQHVQQKMRKSCRWGAGGPQSAAEASAAASVLSEVSCVSCRIAQTVAAQTMAEGPESFFARGRSAAAAASARASLATEADAESTEDSGAEPHRSAFLGSGMPLATTQAPAREGASGLLQRSGGAADDDLPRIRKTAPPALHSPGGARTPNSDVAAGARADQSDSFTCGSQDAARRRLATAASAAPPISKIGALANKVDGFGQRLDRMEGMLVEMHSLIHTLARERDGRILSTDSSRFGLAA